MRVIARERGCVSVYVDKVLWEKPGKSQDVSTSGLLPLPGVKPAGLHFGGSKKLPPLLNINLAKVPTPSTHKQVWGTMYTLIVASRAAQDRHGYMATCSV